MIDSHAHLSSPALRDQIDLMLARAQEKGISHIVNIATDPEELSHAFALTQQYPWIKVVGSTTPHDVDKEGDSAFAFFEAAAMGGQLVAVGETGLDYHYYHETKEKQLHFLRRYLDLAQKAKLPIVIHCRDAFADLFSIFDAFYGKNWGPGVLHCFTGTMGEATKLIEKGWMISISGIVTFKKSEALRQVVRVIPMDHLLIETDSPYLAPHSHRGQQNEPSFLLETAEYVATLKGLDLATFTELTASNTKSFFNIN